MYTRSVPGDFRCFNAFNPLFFLGQLCVAVRRPVECQRDVGQLIGSLLGWSEIYLGSWRQLFHFFRKLFFLRASAQELISRYPARPVLNFQN